MGKLIVFIIVAGVGYAWYSGLIFAPRKPPPTVAAPDRAAEIAARVKAERERIQAEEAATAQKWQPASAPTAARGIQTIPGPRSPQFNERGAAVSSRDANCATARNNVQATGDWMRQGGQVVEKGSGKRLSENQTFDAAARNRQFVEENCR